MSPMTPAIAVSRVGKTYGTGPTAVRALVDVSLDVGGGEVLLMMGPSGSGKTTLLSIMGAILDASSGSVRVRGEELVGLPEREPRGSGAPTSASSSRASISFPR
jgi:putative ABC transport system ATP-binding protein